MVILSRDDFSQFIYYLFYYIVYRQTADKIILLIFRYGLTVFGSSIGISIVNLTTNSVFGTPSQLQTTLNTNLNQGSAVALADGYKAIHEAIRRYQFRSGVQKKILLITDQVCGILFKSNDNNFCL